MSDREKNEPPTCERCGEEYSLDYELEPTKYCHNCAHKVVSDLEERVLQLEKALREIKEIVHRRQLPITHQIWEITDAALEGN